VYKTTRAYNGASMLAHFSSFKWIEGSKTQHRITSHYLKNECTKITMGTNPQLPFRGMKSTPCTPPLNKPTPLLAEEGVSCQCQKVSHLNRNTLRKVYLKREGYHHKKNSSCLVVREFHVLSLLSFRDSIFPSSSLDRSAGLAVVCVFFFFLASDATMQFLDSHRVRVAYTYCESQRIPSP
jgi:hypothetical protein